MQDTRRDVLTHGSGAYRPRSSGLLQGGGLRLFRRRKSAIKGWGKNFPDQMLSHGKEIRENVPDFDPALEFDYTRRELMLLAEKILLSDDRPMEAEPMILNVDMYRRRLKAEIYTADGMPDPAYASGIYWRVHPDGRSWRTPQEMQDQAQSFYR